MQRHYNRALPPCSGGTWFIVSPNRVYLDCDKEPYTEAPILEKQVLALIREKWHHLRQRREKKQRESKAKIEKVATRHKYICTYKAVLMRAKLIWHSVAVWSQKKQSSLQKAQLIVYGVSYFIICETNNSNGKTFKNRDFAQNGCVDTADVRSNGMIVRYFLNRNQNWDEVDVIYRLYLWKQNLVPR